MTAPTRADVDRQLRRNGIWPIPRVLVGLLFFVWTLMVYLFGITTVHLSDKHHTTPAVSTPATAAPFAEECQDGMRVFTTPQGGIAVFPVGGAGCRP